MLCLTVTVEWDNLEELRVWSTARRRQVVDGWKSVGIVRITRSIPTDSKTYRPQWVTPIIRRQTW